MVMCVHFIKKEEKRVGYYIHRFAKKANDLFSLSPPTEIKLPGKTHHISFQPKRTHKNKRLTDNRQYPAQWFQLTGQREKMLQ